MANFLAVMLSVLIMLRPFALPATTLAKLLAANDHFFQFSYFFLAHEELLDVLDLIYIFDTEA